MRQRKKVWSICLVIALVFSSIFTWNEPALTAYASETKTEKIVVYVAAQGKSLDGTKTVAIDKTPVQVDKGTNAAAAVKRYWTLLITKTTMIFQIRDMVLIWNPSMGWEQNKQEKIGITGVSMSMDSTAM